MLAIYTQWRPFRESEAWTLFRVAAIAEAVGWTLLIGGIGLRALLHGNEIPVLIAGRIHGTLFLTYIVACLALAPSLGWSLPRTVLAGLCSVPPYGSLVYEQVVAWLRLRQQLQQSVFINVYGYICSKA